MKFSHILFLIGIFFLFSFCETSIVGKHSAEYSPLVSINPLRILKENQRKLAHEKKSQKHKTSISKKHGLKKRGLKQTQKSMTELKKYAVSSLVGIISAQATASDPNYSIKTQEESMQKNVEKMLTSPELDKAVLDETKLFTGYLKRNNVVVPKDIKVKDMEKILRDYTKVQYQVDHNTFDTVKPLINKVYKTVRSSGLLKV